MKKNRFIYILFTIFCVTGMGLLLGGILYGWHYAGFKKDAEKITGEIAAIESYYDSDHELKHRVYVNYTYDGSDYEEVPINSYSSSMYEGKEIELLCNPENPWEIQEKSAGSFLIIILSGMGILFILVGGIPLLVIVRKNHRNKEVLVNGQVLHAVVDSIEYNTNVAVNGRHPFVIFCSYRDEYKDVIYRFKSGNLWTDPAVVFQPGSPIEVYVEPTDYSKYYVNAEKILEEKVVDFT